MHPRAKAAAFGIAALAAAGIGLCAANRLMRKRRHFEPGDAPGIALGGPSAPETGGELAAGSSRPGARIED